MTRRIALLFLVFCGLALSERTAAWAPVGYTWSFGRDVVMHLRLDRPPGSFPDGSTSWSDSAANALGIWNQQMNTARFVAAGPLEPAYRDGTNTVAFSDTIYGQTFGNNVLAVTVWDYAHVSGGGLFESDVFFNNAKRFDSYRGALQSDANGPIYDFHRVALHEFGHCLGLAHPDERGQSVVAIMNSIVSDLDHLADDDIAGVRSLYWMRLIGQSVSANVSLGHVFYYQLFADNNPSSFSASGLPPGLSIDIATGVITGTPQRSGTYEVKLTAYGASGTATGTLRMTIAPPRITSDSFATSYLGRSFKYQIVADHQPLSYDAINLPAGLTINRETGLISGIPTLTNVPWATIIARGAYEDAVATFSLAVYVPIPPNDIPLASFPSHSIRLLADPNRPRVYGINLDALLVIDPASMTVVKTVPTGGFAVGFSLSPDGHTLWINRTSLKSLARIDLDALDGFTEIPTSEPIDSVYEGLDNRLYAAARNGDLLQLDAATGAITQRVKPSAGFSHMSSSRIAISHDRKTIYVGDMFLVGGSLVSRAAISRYDISSDVPVLSQRVEVPAPSILDMVIAPGDDLVYAVMGTNAGSGSRATHSTLCLAANDLNVTKGTLSYQGTGGPITITSDNKLALQMLQIGDGGGFTTALLKMFDPVTFQLKKTIVLGTNKSFGIGLGGAVVDRGGSYIFAAASVTPPLQVYSAQLPPAPPTPAQSLLNLSTRLRTQQGNDALIGGFIVTGDQSKKLILRAVGPSLPMAGKLGDPRLELYGADAKTIAENDNWNSHRDDVLATGLAPSDEHESAIVATLQPGAYTAILRGSTGSAGIAVVEIYDLSPSLSSRMANISTRGKVETGDNVMIGGFILGGDQVTNVVVRAIGPSLTQFDVAGALEDPTLAVHDGNGALLAQDDDWRMYQEQALIDSGFAPTDNRESAMLLWLQPGPYTAIVRGKDDRVGVGLVEVYNLDAK